MIRVLVLMLVCLLAPAARAEVATVTSGEHATYSRLLIALPSLGDWQLTRQADGYALAVADATGFDVSRAFDRIPRTRVEALFADPQDGRLIIRVPCSCHAIGFRYDAQHLVIDLRDGPPPVRSAFELSDSGTPMSPLLAGGLAPERRTAAGFDWLTSWREPALAAQTLPWPLRTDTPDDDRHLPDAQAESLRAALMAEFARGAATGLVRMNLPDGDEVIAPDGLHINDQDTAGLAILAGSEPEQGLDAAGGDCPATSRFDIAAWAQPEDLLTQFGLHRRALVGEFDAPDAAAVTAAVRFYLHLGFGAEARDMMTAYPAAAEDAAVLMVLADVMEGQQVDSAVVSPWIPCDTAAALWATLALPGDASAAADANVLRSAFSNLPPHLRNLFAPRIEAHAASLQNQELLASVTNTTERGTPSVAKGTSAAALLQAWRDGGPDEGAAALAYVAAAQATRAAIPPEVPAALQSLAEEHAGLADGDDLARAARIVAALAGDFDTAFADPGLVAAMPELWALLHETADADTFMILTITQQEAFPPAQTGLATRIAERLLSLSLPELALGWLPPEPPADPASALAAATALVELGRGGDALPWLEGLTDPAAVALRAAAADQAGDHALAAASWADAGDNARAARSGRLSGDLAAAEQGSAWVRLATDLRGAPRPLTDEATGPLQTAEALVTRSERLRADISELLQSTDIPESP